MSDNGFSAGQDQFNFPDNGHYGAYPDNPYIDYDHPMSAPYGLDIGTFSDQFIQTFNTDFRHRLPWDYTPQAGSTPMATVPAPSMSGPSTSSNSPHHLPWDYTPQAGSTPIATVPASFMGAASTSSISLAMPAPSTLAHTITHVTRGHHFQPAATTAPSMGALSSSISLAIPPPDTMTHTVGDVAEDHLQPEATDQVHTVILPMPQPDNAVPPVHYCTCCEWCHSSLLLFTS